MPNVRQSIYDTQLYKQTRTTSRWVVFSQAKHKDPLNPDRIHLCDPFLFPQSYHSTRKAARIEAAQRNKFVATTALQKMVPIKYRVGRCTVSIRVWSVR